MKSLVALMITGLLASAGALAQESKSAAPAPAAPAAAAPSAAAPAGEEPAKKTAHHKKKKHKAVAKTDTDTTKSGAMSTDAAKPAAPAASSDMKK
jgi:hypothetical protein